MGLEFDFTEVGMASITILGLEGQMPHSFSAPSSTAVHRALSEGGLGTWNPPMCILLPRQGRELQQQGLGLCVHPQQPAQGGHTQALRVLNEAAEVDLRFGSSKHLDAALKNQVGRAGQYILAQGN